MEGIVTYIGFMAMLMVVTSLVFSSNLVEQRRTVTSNGSVSPYSKAGNSTKPGQGYWDYLIVSGFAGLVLIVNFIANF